jgi:hypothetical protein
VCRLQGALRSASPILITVRNVGMLTLPQMTSAACLWPSLVYTQAKFAFTNQHALPRTSTMPIQVRYPPGWAVPGRPRPGRRVRVHVDRSKHSDLHQRDVSRRSPLHACGGRQRGVLWAMPTEFTTHGPMLCAVLSVRCANGPRLDGAACVHLGGRVRRPDQVSSGPTCDERAPQPGLSGAHSLSACRSTLCVCRARRCKHWTIRVDWHASDMVPSLLGLHTVLTDQMQAHACHEILILI